MACFNCTCLSAVKAVLESGSDSTTRTECAGTFTTVGADEAGGGIAGAESATALTQSASSLASVVAYLPAAQFVHTVLESAPLVVKYVP